MTQQEADLLLTMDADHASQRAALIASLVGSPPPAEPPPAGGDLVVGKGETLVLYEGWSGRDVLIDGGLLSLAGETISVRTIRVVNGGRLDPSDGVIVFADVPLDPADVEQIGNGLIVDGGTFKGSNFTVKSENPNGVRGHIICQHHSDVEIDAYTLLDLGRTTIDPISATNVIARYPLHFHHCYVPGKIGPQFSATNGTIRNTVPTRCKWGIVIHASHYGLIKGNQLYNMAGAGIVCEDGSESYNVIEGNLVDGVTGSGLRSDAQNFEGHEGAAFWFRGPNNYVRGNIARNAYAGFMCQCMYAPWVEIPAAPGEHGTIRYNPMVATILENRDNTAEDCGNGLQYWWLGGPEADYYSQFGVAGRNVFKNFTARRCSEAGIYPYPGQRITIEGGLLEDCYWGIRETDYTQNEFEVNGTAFRRCQIGFGVSSGNTHAGRNLIFDDCETDIQAGWQYSSNGPAQVKPRKITLEDNQHGGKVWICRAGSEGNEGNQNRDVPDEMTVKVLTGELLRIHFAEKAPPGAVEHPNIVGMVEAI